MFRIGEGPDLLQPFFLQQLGEGSSEQFCFNDLHGNEGKSNSIFLFIKYILTATYKYFDKI